MIDVGVRLQLGKAASNDDALGRRVGQGPPDLGQRERFQFETSVRGGSSLRCPSCSIPPSASSSKSWFLSSLTGYLWLRLRVDLFFKSDYQSVQSLKILEL